MGNLTMSFKDLNTYAARVSNGITLIDETEFANLMQELTRISQLGGTVFVAGNGGGPQRLQRTTLELCCPTGHSTATYCAGDKCRCCCIHGLL